LAVVKPPGQFTQGSWAPPHTITLETAVRQYLNPADPAAVYLGIVHRLDRPTSGLLIWAKTPRAARRLSRQFERRKVVKEYWAVVESAPRPAGDRGDEIWTNWLTRADNWGIVHAAEPRALGSREAVTRVRWAPAGSLPSGCTWLRLWPQTGRTHQLRVQAALRGLPIMGDSEYGSTMPSPLADGITLHAYSLAFHHPITGGQLLLTAPLPGSWAQGGIVLPEQQAGDSPALCPNQPGS